MNLSLSQKLSILEKPIRVGIAGAGEFGKALATQISMIRNMEVVVMADLKPQAAVDVFLAAGYHLSDLGLARSISEANRLISLGRQVVLEDALIMNHLPIDVVCDVTGDPGFGASFAFNAIENRKHVVVINIEADVVTGPILRRLADKAGVVYTEGDGDQPSLIKGLCDWADLLGLGVFAAGKWTHIRPEQMHRADGKRSDIGYDDGSKNQVEMCCVANMTGLVPDVRGMHMPSLGLTDLVTQFDLLQAGGILSRKGIVDVVNCLMPDGRTVIEPLLGGGVFIIVETENQTARDVILTKGFLHNADGSHALIYRPYHFVGIETPISIARAVLHGEPTGAPLPVPVADVMAIAKRDLQPGERLDGIGGQAVRGVIERFDQAAGMRALPLGLAEGVCVNRAIAKGAILTYDMLEREGDSMIWQLRRQQDQFCEVARQQA